jgi:predicted transcriptional regulator
MPKAVRDVPPPLELLCLNALWFLKQGNVKDVRQIVAQKRPLAYTTIMTVLDRLVRKGKLARRKVGRAFVYVPEVSRESMRWTAVHELVDSLFGGSEEELVQFLRGTAVHAAAAAAGGETVSAAAPASAAGESPIDTVLL